MCVLYQQTFFLFHVYFGTREGALGDGSGRFKISFAFAPTANRGIIIVRWGSMFLAFVPTNLHPHEPRHDHLFNIYQNFPDYTANAITSPRTKKTLATQYSRTLTPRLKMIPQHFLRRLKSVWRTGYRTKPSPFTGTAWYRRTLHGWMALPWSLNVP